MPVTAMADYLSLARPYVHVARPRNCGLQLLVIMIELELEFEFSTRCAPRQPDFLGDSGSFKMNEPSKFWVPYELLAYALE